MLEQEIASIIKFVLDKTGNPSPYYWKVPENFNIPAAYFPTPEIVTGGETFLTYRMEYTWFIVFFHHTDNEAYALGLQALTAIRGNRNLVPLINTDGEETGKWLRLADPKLKVLDSDACQVEINWVSRRPYDSTLVDSEKMMSFEVEGWSNPDIYISRTIDAAFAAAISSYGIDYPDPEYSGQEPVEAD